MTATGERAIAGEAARPVEPPLESDRRERRPTIRIEPRRTGLRHAYGELWRHRLLIGYFGHKFLRKRIARTWLGLIWFPLRPGANLFIRTFVFGSLIGVSAGRAPYPVFFLVASAGWQLFSECAYWATRSQEMNRKLLGRIEVPRLTVIVAAAAPAFVDAAMVVGFGLLTVLYYVVRAHIFYFDIGVRTLLLPAGVALLILLGLGVGLLLSGAAARARDIRFGVMYALSFLYFLTPVIYPVTKIPTEWRGLAGLNPVTGALELVKAGLFADSPLSLKALGVTLFAVFLIWGPGLWLFDRREVAALRGESGASPVARVRRVLSRA